MSRPPRPDLDRRALLGQASSGFGLLALGSLLGEQAGAAARGGHGPSHGLHPAARLTPRAKKVVLCYMSGGMSHLDSFDPKPRLAREAGEPMPMRVERTQFDDNGRIFPSPFPFARHGESGLPISSLFPELARHADRMAVVRSMTSPANEHAQGNIFFHTGFQFEGHPTAGAWVGYGLGSMNRDLPGYVVLRAGGSSLPIGGVGMYGSAYLPAQHQPSILEADAVQAVRDVRPRGSLELQGRRLDLVRRLGRGFADAPGHEAVQAAALNLETAARMQTSVPELCDLSGESTRTKERYGLDSPDGVLAAYGRQALLARRLVERGVRFVELTCLTRGIGAGNAGNPWDQHGELERGHGAMARQVDQPIAALMDDLAARGLLEETLVVFATEFGRTPFSQGSNGRDHNPFGFCVWLAGAGIRGGTVHGATDDYGYHAVESPHTIWDLWATVLHTLGLEHRHLTWRHAGRDFRLSDVHGQPIDAILA